MTANMIAATRLDKTTEQQFADMIETLCTYLPCDQDLEDEVDLQALQIMKQKAV